MALAAMNGIGVPNGDCGHHYAQVPLVDEFDGSPRRSDPTFLERLQTLCETTWFQAFIGAVIIANATVIGFETDNEGFWLWQALEDAFLIVFVCELCLKLLAYGFGFFRASHREFVWNVLDTLIVVAGVADRGFTHMAAFKKFGSVTSDVTMTTLMRLFRLLRILRIFRIFRVLKQLYLLAASMLEAASAVLWVSFLCSLIMYICSIITTRLIGRPDPGDPQADFRVAHFGSISASMLTLFELMAYPDMEKFQPIYEQSAWTEGFLVAFVIFGSFAIVSLLTGIISESMIEKSRVRQDEGRLHKEKGRQAFVQHVRSMLQEHDDGGQGFLDRGQFEECKQDVLRLCGDASMEFTARDLDAMFGLVDYEGTNTIEIEELLYALVQLAAEVRPMAIMELRRLVVCGLHGVTDRVDGVDARLQLMDRRLCEVLAAVRQGPLSPLSPAALRQPSPTHALPPPAATRTRGYVSEILPDGGLSRRSPRRATTTGAVASSSDTVRILAAQPDVMPRGGHDSGGDGRTR